MRRPPAFFSTAFFNTALFNAALFDTAFFMIAVLAVLGAACAPPAAVDLGQPMAVRADSGQPVEHLFGLPPHALEATVAAVIDGDTIMVNIGNNTETLRLLGIDTPEKPGGPRPAECHGQEATDLAVALLPEGTRVLLARDDEPRDLYGRLLTYVYRADDDLFVNLTMLEHGAAEPMSITPNDTFEDLFAQTSNQARRDQRGLWGTCGSADVVLEPDR